MRVVSWAFVLCAALVAISAFMPSVELDVAGRSVGKRSRLSLYAASRDRDAVTRLVAAYHRSDQARTGAEIARVAAPRIHGRGRAALDNAHDAMTALDDVSDHDAAAAGTVLTAALWTLLGLDAVMLALVFGALMRGSYRGGRLAAALAASVAVAAIAVALHLVCREAAWQANDEVGRSVVELAVGAYLLPAAAIAGLATAIALVIRRRRELRPARG